MGTYRAKALACIFLFTALARGNGTAQAEDYEFFMTRAAHLGYGNNYFRSEQVPYQFSQLGIKTKSDPKSDRAKPLQWNVEGFFTTAEEIFVVNPIEIRWKVTKTSDSMQVGRVLENWSAADSYWRRGNWQPRFTWNKLNSEQQGLAGAFFTGGSASQRWLFMASPIFVPEFGPQINLENGQFTSSNPWFRPPPAKVNVLNKITPTRYRLFNPSIEEVALNPSVAFRMEQEVSRSTVALAYAYKPINQLIYSAPFNLDLSETSNLDLAPLNIDVHTRPVRHHIVTGEWLFATGGFNSLFSATYEKPVDNFELKDTSLNQLSRESTILDFVLFPSQSRYSAFRPHFGIMRQWGGDRPSDNDFVAGSFVFERRQQYFEAYKIGFDYQSSFAKQSTINFRQEAIYDAKQLAAALVSDLNFQFNPNQSIGLRLEVLGIVSDEIPKEEAGFLRDYRANDRVTFEFAYAY